MEKVKQDHFKEYAADPETVVSTPGRFHLMGEHSWFFKDKTLSMAVNLPVYVAASRHQDPVLRFHFVQLKDRKKTSLTSLKFKKEDKWANAVKSVVYGFQSGGIEVPGIDITISSEILPSAGFGITTAIKIGTAWAINQLLSRKLSEAELLQVIERGNRRFLNSENYIADNFSAIFSKKGFLTLTDHEKGSWENIPFDYSDKVVVLTDAKVPRLQVWNEDTLFQMENILVMGELRERKSSVFGGWQYIANQTEIGEVFSVVAEDTRRRLTYIMNEHKNVLNAVTSLLEGQFGKFAYSVNESHEIMRDLYDASCPEIDWILKRVKEISSNPGDARNPGSCGRITGKGFGRCVFAILNREDVPLYQKKLAEYSKIFGFKAESYIVETADGVQVLM